MPKKKHLIYKEAVSMQENNLDADPKSAEKLFKMPENYFITRILFYIHSS